MKFTKLWIVCVFLITVSNILLAEDNLIQEAKETLDKGVEFFHKEVSTEGGYLWTYSADLTERRGEVRATKTQIWVQPPGTPSVGFAYLRTYKATDNKKCLKAAKDAAEALIWGQLACGGWDYKIDFSNGRWYYRHEMTAGKLEKGRNRATFDDNTTQSALRFLMAIDEMTDKTEYHDAVKYGLSFMLESQFENGAWPQRYPLDSDNYSRFYTFNDSTINDCIDVMLDAYQIYGEKRYLESVKRAGDFIILSQLPEPQAGWAQQYNYELEPAWARSFEPPGVCSAVTSRNIRTLIKLYVATGEKKYLEPIPAAIDWLQKSKTDDNLWARLYEVGSNKPIYGDRMDGNKIHYDYDKISEKERRSYGWQGSYGIPGSINRYKKIKEIGREKQIAQQKEEPTREQKLARMKELESRVRNVISQQDEKGRWITDGKIRTRDFIRNLRYLSRYLGLAKDLDKLNLDE